MYDGFFSVLSVVPSLLKSQAQEMGLLDDLSVKATVNGKQRLTGLAIEREVINAEEQEMLEDLILAAVNKALEESQKMAQEEMSKVTSGILPNIPGLNLPGF